MSCTNQCVAQVNLCMTRGQKYPQGAGDVWHQLTYQDSGGTPIDLSAYDTITIQFRNTVTANVSYQILPADIDSTGLNVGVLKFRVPPAGTELIDDPSVWGIELSIAADASSNWQFVEGTVANPLPPARS